MPKPKNETIASCPCSVKGCTEQADVRREKNHERGALYLVCPVHGRLSANGARYKEKMGEWISNNMQPFQEPGQEPAPEPVPEPVPEPETNPVAVLATVPAEVPEKPGKGRSFWSGAGSELDDFLK